ncbi:hypothetical protein CAPTEDRAFT_191675 [Capitella teleta]|uniref:Uncharacterized protein n=1 Tax=Capitella teleta TaxID=283909 RepID=R7V6Z7_CAPTE|nr:hypothetical protein CAPTEDRAFT_191675 [Capitella teleta]|eukprot:ELU14207.1 hypothetical protein CAPTEDRAFT_191675 [Capitella teleta]
MEVIDIGLGSTLVFLGVACQLSNGLLFHRLLTTKTSRSLGFGPGVLDHGFAAAILLFNLPRSVQIPHRMISCSFTILSALFVLTLLLDWLNSSRKMRFSTIFTNQKLTMLVAAMLVIVVPIGLACSLLSPSRSILLWLVVQCVLAFVLICCLRFRQRIRPVLRSFMQIRWSRQRRAISLLLVMEIGMVAGRLVLLAVQIFLHKSSRLTVAQNACQAVYLALRPIIFHFLVQKRRTCSRFNVKSCTGKPKKSSGVFHISSERAAKIPRPAIVDARISMELHGTRDLLCFNSVNAAPAIGSRKRKKKKRSSNDSKIRNGLSMSITCTSPLPVEGFLHRMENTVVRDPDSTTTGNISPISCRSQITVCNTVSFNDDLLAQGGGCSSQEVGSLDWNLSLQTQRNHLGVPEQNMVLRLHSPLRRHTYSSNSVESSPRIVRTMKCTSLVTNKPMPFLPGEVYEESSDEPQTDEILQLPRQYQQAIRMDVLSDYSSSAAYVSASSGDESPVEENSVRMTIGKDPLGGGEARGEEIYQSRRSDGCVELTGERSGIWLGSVTDKGVSPARGGQGGKGVSVTSI